MIHYKIRKGRWPSQSNAPVQIIEGTKRASKAAMIGSDFMQLRPVFQVQSGDRVSTGDILFHDRKHPEIAHVAPFSGTVSRLEFGARRTLSACVIERDPPQDEPLLAAEALDDTSAAAVRETLLSRGMWPALRMRPFGDTPDPNTRPAAIFVNASQRGATAPDPHVVLEGRSSHFAKGIAALSKLTDGPVFLCQSDDTPLCPENHDVTVAIFVGAESSGLSGTHIDRLHTVQSGKQVWTIGYQDVAAIGHLFETGQYSAEVVVSVTGPMVKAPKLLRTTRGAQLTDITAGELLETDAKPFHLSGDDITGRKATYLGRFHDQITINESPSQPLNATRQTQTASQHQALIPLAALDRALGPRILPVPLMRALAVGDSETAHRLGCLALVEEDVAILTRHCTSGADYGALLRQVLDDLRDDAA